MVQAFCRPTWTLPWGAVPAERQPFLPAGPRIPVLPPQPHKTPRSPTQLPSFPAPQPSPGNPQVPRGGMAETHPLLTPQCWSLSSLVSARIDSSSMASTWLERNLVHITRCSRQEGSPPYHQKNVWARFGHGSAHARTHTESRPVAAGAIVRTGGDQVWAQKDRWAIPAAQLLLRLPRVPDLGLRVKDCRWSKPF